MHGDRRGGGGGEAQGPQDQLARPRGLHRRDGAHLGSPAQRHGEHDPGLVAPRRHGTSILGAPRADAQDDDERDQGAGRAAAVPRRLTASVVELRPYGWRQPAGYQVVRGSSPGTDEDAALVQIGWACVEPEPDGTEKASSTDMVSSTSFTPPEGWPRRGRMAMGRSACPSGASGPVDPRGEARGGGSTL